MKEKKKNLLKKEMKHKKIGELNIKRIYQDVQKDKVIFII
jgi:hypothetical protein